MPVYPNNDLRYAPQFPALVNTVWGQTFVSASTSATSNRIYGGRAIVPRAGTLHDFWTFIVTTSGNFRGVIYDTGDASAGNRTKLWDSGSVAVGSTGWQNIGDPNLSVNAGKQIDLAIQFDNGTVAFGRSAAAQSNNTATLPSALFLAPGGINPKMGWFNDPGSFAATTPLAEASASTLTIAPTLLCRIA